MTGDTNPAARLGTIEELEGRHVLRYERHLDHPIEHVWEALTTAEGLVRWLAAAEELELVEGGRIALRWLNVPENVDEWKQQGVELGDRTPADVVARGKVTRVEAPRLIEYETDDLGVMRWELRAEGSGCALTFTNTLELPDRVPPEQTLAGWHVHLDHLAAALEGRSIDWSTWTEDYMDVWAEIRDRYALAARREHEIRSR